MAGIRITVLIPTLNEEADIAGCIEAVGAQEYPLGDVQVIVVDAASDDGTRAEVERVAGGHKFGDVVILDSPARRISTGLNVGLHKAAGTFIARVDARSRIPAGYLRACEATLTARPDIGVVGGAQVAAPRTSRKVDIGIAAALRNRLATGLSRYRRSTVSGPSDTVWMGFFRTDELLAFGGWSEAVVLNEDYELNERYRHAGRTVWFDASLRSAYLPRSSMSALARQYFRFGRAKGASWGRGTRPAVRQLGLVALPPAFGAVMAGLVRRWGPAGLLLAPLALAAVERAGRSDRPGDAKAPAMAASAIGVVSSSWWLGVVSGIAGELAKARDEHA